MDKENAVRDAALALQNAIADAVAAGYRVVWPANAGELDRIAISETSRVKPPDTTTRASTLSRPAPGDTHSN